MKLNPDCFRDILIAVEKLPADNNSLDLCVPGYSEEEIASCVKELSDNGFLEATFLYFDGESHFNISGLTDEGRQLLEELRENKVKRFIKKNGKEILSFLIDHLLPFLK